MTTADDNKDNRNIEDTVNTDDQHNDNDYNDSHNYVDPSDRYSTSSDDSNYNNDPSLVGDSTDTVDKFPEDEWKHRTFMAYVALAAIIIMTALLFYTVDADKISKISEFITWFYLGMTSIVGAYMGLRSWASKSLIK